MQQIPESLATLIAAEEQEKAYQFANILSEPTSLMGYIRRYDITAGDVVVAAGLTVLAALGVFLVAL